MSATSAVNRPRRRRWSSAGAIRYRVLGPSSSQPGVIVLSPIVAAAIVGSCHGSSAVAIVCSRLERKRGSASHTDRSACSAGCAPGRAAGLEQLGWFVFACCCDPGEDLAHRQVAVRGGEQQRREEPRAGGPPECLVRVARGAVVADAEEPCGGATCAFPCAGGEDRRPRGVWQPGGAGRVEDPDLAPRGPGGVGVVHDVALDRCGQRGARPLQAARARRARSSCPTARGRAPSPTHAARRRSVLPWWTPSVTRPGSGSRTRSASSSPREANRAARAPFP